ELRMFGLIASLFAVDSRRATPTKSLSLEVLEDRCVPDATSVLNSLQDTGLRALAKTDYANDHILSRTEMISIFRRAAQDGQVTTIELSDLKKLANNGPTLGM